jgi:hypothetical protein
MRFRAWGSVAGRECRVAPRERKIGQQTLEIDFSEGALGAHRRAAEAAGDLYDEGGCYRTYSAYFTQTLHSHNLATHKVFFLAFSLFVRLEYSFAWDSAAFARFEQNELSRN